MHVYDFAPFVFGVLYAGFWFISGINLFRGRGTRARKIKDMADGKDMSVYMRIQGCVLTAFGVCIFFTMPYHRLMPVDTNVMIIIGLLLFVIMLVTDRIYTGKYWPKW